MTRKDFELIAKSLNGSLHAAQDLEFDCHTTGGILQAGIRATITNMASALATTNPRFDRERFIAAATK